MDTYFAHFRKRSTIWIFVPEIEFWAVVSVDVPWHENGRFRKSLLHFFKRIQLPWRILWYFLLECSLWRFDRFQIFQFPLIFIKFLFLSILNSLLFCRHFGPILVHDGLIYPLLFCELSLVRLFVDPELILFEKWHFLGLGHALLFLMHHFFHFYQFYRFYVLHQLFWLWGCLANFFGCATENWGFVESIPKMVRFTQALVHYFLRAELKRVGNWMIALAQV